MRAKIFAGLVLGILLLTGCGGGPSTPIPNQAPAASAAPRASDAPASTAPRASDAPRPSTAPVPTAIPAIVPTVPAQVENLGLWKYGALDNPPYPAPAADGQIIVAHGDITGTGTCNIRTFGPHAPITGLGNGTFRLVRVTGNGETIDREWKRMQEEAARPVGGCPALP